MNFLELVQKTVRRSGAKVDEPTTVVDQSGISKLMVEFVQDSWKDIQLERLGFNWRVDRNLTLALVSGTHEYGIGSGLESLNTNSLTIALSGEQESKIYFQTYAYYQREVDRVTRTTGKPLYFTISPDATNFIFWPEPDDVYTVYYEGIKSIDELDATDAAGVGTSDLLIPAGLDPVYHDAILWQAIMNYAMHFEDGSKLSEGQVKFLPYKKYFEARYMPIPTVATSAMYSTYNLYYG
jgi:hypothetical protein